MVRAVQAAPKQKHPTAKFSTYSLPELLEVKSHIESEIKSRQATEIEKLRSKAAETAHTFGMSVEEMMGVSRRRISKHARGKQPAKYRGPHGEEWSGRGPAPRWMKPFLVKGKTKEDFLIR